MEPVVTIAIPDLSGPAARLATLQALARHTPELYEIVLLVEETQAQQNMLQQNGHLARMTALPAPFNTSAGLNRVLVTCTTPYILLLESGSIVTSGWLDKLLAPLNDPTVGLSGPSTNSSWNEQKVLTGSEGTGWSVQQIDTYAAHVAKSYANQWHSLDTLHSLGDFCYLFKRTVAEQLGGFDEAYGAGPCWEIDFSTRAARAGFRAIWVADAYVHRSPVSSWKATSVRHYLTASKQLYQDRFCGLRLEGKKTDYEPHCRGEACEHFAPHNLIQITLQPGLIPTCVQACNRGPEARQAGRYGKASLPIDRAGASPAPTTQLSIKDRPVENPSVTPTLSASSNLPLVSCIMPTRNRRAFIRQALSYFERQDYPNRELIIVDDGNERIDDLLPSDSRIHYITLPRPTSIGAKRNIACEQAHGAIIAHWDDDDWYAPHRLSHQIEPLLSKKADITGLEATCFFDLPQWQAWSCTPELHRRLFLGDVHGGTLVYWRNIWQHMAHYPEYSLAEDALFLRAACRRGARLQKLPNAHSFVYIRHNSNAWSFPLGSYLQPAGWRHTNVQAFILPADLPFYATLSPSAPNRQESVIDGTPHTLEPDGESRNALHIDEPLPLVSCIMPTYNRRMFVPQAIQYFLRQDYANRELIILDDGSDAVDDLIPVDQRIRYIRLREKATTGAKRNLACEHARGTIIAHWDDDDWHAPHRLRYQVAAILREGTTMCGTNTLLFYDIESERAWQYVYPKGQRMWLSGNTLCYERTFWASNHFADVDVGEDARFVWANRHTGITTLEDTTFHVGIIHKQNISPKHRTGPYWHSYPVEEIQHLLGIDWSFYQLHQEREHSQS